MICYDFVVFVLPWSIHVVGDGDKFLKPTTDVNDTHLGENETMQMYDIS